MIVEKELDVFNAPNEIVSIIEAMLFLLVRMACNWLLLDKLEYFTVNAATGYGPLFLQQELSKNIKDISDIKVNNFMVVKLCFLSFINCLQMYFVHNSRVYFS